MRHIEKERREIRCFCGQITEFLRSYSHNFSLQVNCVHFLKQKRSPSLIHSLNLQRNIWRASLLGMGTPIHRGYHSAPKDRMVPYRNTINKQLQCGVEKENQVQVQRKAIQHRDWLAQHSLACSAESRCKQIPGQPESKVELQETTDWRMRWTGTGSERPWWVQQKSSLLIP